MSGPTDGNDGAEALDLSAEPAAAAEEFTPETFAPTTEAYDPAPERERIRGWIALLLVFLLVGVVAAAFVSLWVGLSDSDGMKSVMDLVLAPIVGLVGAVTGFYYGEKSG